MNRSGFSLVELLVVMAIIGILTALIVTGMVRMHNASLLNDAAGNVSRAVTRATATVRSSSRKAVISIDEANRLVKVTSNGSVVFQADLPVNSVVFTCRSGCTGTTAALTAPGGRLVSDFQVQLVRRSDDRIVRVTGPSSLVVIQ